ncbi:MAG TPA: recombinase family protein, partial [Ruminococcus sp.]|nr:recombinase family protein [Ruminococcus sp.]
DYIDGKLIVNEYEAMQVKEVFELFLNGKSINSIYHYMTDKYGNLWSSASKISNTLKNPVYIGHVRFRGKEYEGIHTPIVDEETFKRANEMLVSDERMSKLTAVQKSPFRAGFLLSSMIYCKQCGARYSANHGYYKCYSRSKSSPRFITDPDCKNENWKIDELDELVINQLKELCIEENLNKVIDFNVKYKPAENTDFLKNQIKEIETKISKLIELYQISEIPNEDIKEKITNLSNEKENLKKQLYNQQNNSIEKKVSEFIKAVEKFKTSFFDSDLDQKRIIMSSIIRKINVDGKSIVLEWRL